mmetsp:Transcript_18646/g.19291  ORF Transcript_18646/g.19291 Transcript_18646/m.19291 type:complete len:318 (+) Transcript_18646:1-954(+)
MKLKFVLLLISVGLCLSTDFLSSDPDPAVNFDFNKNIDIDSLRQLRALIYFIGHFQEVYDQPLPKKIEASINFTGNRENMHIIKNLFVEADASHLEELILSRLDIDYTGLKPRDFFPEKVCLKKISIGKTFYPLDSLEDNSKLSEINYESNPDGKYAIVDFLMSCLLNCNDRMRVYEDNIIEFKGIPLNNESIKLINNQLYENRFKVEDYRNTKLGFSFSYGTISEHNLELIKEFFRRICQQGQYKATKLIQINYNYGLSVQNARDLISYILDYHCDYYNGLAIDFTGQGYTYADFSDMEIQLKEEKGITLEGLDLF